MCRSIRTLHNFVPPATEEEIRAAAAQYVRKIAGVTRPSQANAAAFDEAVEAVTGATRRLVGALVTSAPPKTREAEQARARIEAKGIAHQAAETGRVLTVSAGVASLVPDARLQPSSLLDEADRALYQAKAGGRNCVRVAGAPAIGGPSQ